MMMRSAHHRVPLAVAALGLAACVTRGDIEEIKQGLKEINTKLDRGARPQQPQQRPQGPDATAVYAFPVGDSPAKGPADAWVTVIESSDFQ